MSGKKFLLIVLSMLLGLSFVGCRNKTVSKRALEDDITHELPFVVRLTNTYTMDLAENGNGFNVKMTLKYNECDNEENCRLIASGFLNSLRDVEGITGVDATFVNYDESFSSRIKIDNWEDEKDKVFDKDKLKLVDVKDLKKTT